MLWSILICGLPERYHTVQPLLYSLLEKQSVARLSDVELLYFMDNRRRSVGAKRNALLDAARGEYVSFIDDDDMVADDYVRRIYDAIVATRRQTPPADVICFGQRATLQPHGVTHECTYSIQNKTRELRPTDRPGVFAWTGPPAHTMVWRRAMLEGLRFPDRQFGEDVELVDEACKRAKTEIQIAHSLYEYRFDEAGSATRG